jgi:hypothetical protein
MVTCSDGHSSQATDYCDVCGTPIVVAVPDPAPTVLAGSCPACGSPIAGRFCEVCGHDSALPASDARVAPTVRVPDIAESAPAESGAASNLFAAAPDSLGETVLLATSVSVAAPEPVAEQTVWTAVVAADHDFYQRVLAREGPDAERVEFPSYYPERRILLVGTDFLIGKRSVSQGLQPDIDLGIAPADIGVSRSHARLHVDGAELTVTDLGSTNGTSLNGSEELLPPETPVPLRSGDRIHVGGWTTITVTTEPA